MIYSLWGVSLKTARRRIFFFSGRHPPRFGVTLSILMISLNRREIVIVCNFSVLIEAHPCIYEVYGEKGFVFLLC